jgi:hypothetical protein
VAENSGVRQLCGPLTPRHIVIYDRLHLRHVRDAKAVFPEPQGDVAAE